MIGCIQSWNSEILVYTPGFPGYPQPIDQLVIPARVNLPSWAWTTIGPPLSPYKKLERHIYNYVLRVKNWKPEYKKYQIHQMAPKFLKNMHVSAILAIFQKGWDGHALFCNTQKCIIAFKRFFLFPVPMNI